MLDLKSFKWDLVNARGDLPPSRDDHTAVFYENSMLIFGGFIQNGERTNSIYRYFFKDNKWEKVQVLGSVQPVTRAGHSAVIHGDTMVVFGGRDSESNKLNDLWVFNLASYVWEKQECPEWELPMGRSGHSACLYKDMMLVFGGIYEVTKELNDLYIYDFRNKRWITFFEEACSPAKMMNAVSQHDSNSPKKSFTIT